MGICPCHRESPAVSESVPPLETPTSCDPEAPPPDQCDKDRLSLRSAAVILRLVGPITAYYHLLDSGKTSKYAVAEFIGTKQPCMIQTLMKEKYRQSVQMKMALFATLMRLDHPHILKTYEICQDQEKIYIVSELAEGGNMHKYLEVRGRLSQSESATAIHQVLSAVAYCHQQGVLHGHITTHSLLLKESSSNLNLKLSGLESQLSEGKLGTAHVPTEKGDVWACGVLLYIFLSGRHPFAQDSASQRPRKGFSFPPTLWSSVSTEVIPLIVSMLNKHPGERPTALQCMAHPWMHRFATFQVGAVPVKTSLNQLRTSDSGKSLKEVMVRFMINRVMKGSELEKMAEVFSRLDLNGDGFISREELYLEFKKTMSDEQAAKEAARVIAKVDQNWNGQIDYTEFLLSSFSDQKLLTRSNLQLAFNSLDRDASGAISIHELKHFFRINSSPGSARKWEEYISQYDTSGDGELDFMEFEALMKKAFAT